MLKFLRAFLKSKKRKPVAVNLTNLQQITMGKYTITIETIARSVILKLPKIKHIVVQKNAKERERLFSFLEDLVQQHEDARHFFGGDVVVAGVTINEQFIVANSEMKMCIKPDNTLKNTKQLLAILK